MRYDVKILTSADQVTCRGSMIDCNIGQPHDSPCPLSEESPKSATSILLPANDRPGRKMHQLKYWVQWIRLVICLFSVSLPVACFTSFIRQSIPVQTGSARFRPRVSCLQSQIPKGQVSRSRFQCRVPIERDAEAVSNTPLLPVLGAAEFSAIHRNRDDGPGLLVGTAVFDIFKKLKSPVQSP